VLIHCCECNKKVEARLTDGEEIYPNRRDLSVLPFWVCDECKGYVGCHHKTKNRTNPLGCIANQEMRKARIEIHKILDPLWKGDKPKRKSIYSKITSHIGWKYHTSQIRTIEEAREIYRFIRDLSLNCKQTPNKV